jgi:hypothetical protein
MCEKEEDLQVNNTYEDDYEDNYEELKLKKDGDI